MSRVIQPISGHEGVRAAHGAGSEGAGIPTCSLPVRCNTLLPAEWVSEANIETSWFKLTFPDARCSIAVEKTLGIRKSGSVHLRLRQFVTDFAILPRGFRENGGQKAFPSPGCCLDSAKNKNHLHHWLCPWNSWQIIMVCSGVAVKSSVSFLLWFSSTWKWEKAQEEFPWSFRRPLQVLPAVIHRPPFLTKLVMATSILPRVPIQEAHIFSPAATSEHPDHVSSPKPVLDCTTCALPVHGF